VFADLGQRVTQLMRLVEEVAFQRLDRRLAQFLVREVNGGAEHALALTHQEIAERLGTAREIVSRVLGSFALQGFVELGRKRVRVIDIPSLRSVAGAPDPA
jgi:CRP/FNR family transcriptional regulator